MRATNEHERKLDARAGFRLPPLGGRPLEPRVFTSVYYDVPGGSLASAGITLRRRTERGRSVWQLKLPSEDFRLELEAEGGPVKPPPELLDLLHAHLRHGPLERLAELRTRRRGELVARNGATAATGSFGGSMESVAGPPYSGHCMCGGVRFEVTEEPLSAGYCHCTRCQRRTGTAASAQARVAPGGFRLLAGEELVREYAPADGWPKCFCGNCGSALWSKYPDTGEVGSVRLGLLDSGHGIRPQWHTFVDYACEWEPIPDDGLERYPEGKPR